LGSWAWTSRLFSQISNRVYLSFNKTRLEIIWI